MSDIALDKSVIFRPAQAPIHDNGAIGSSVSKLSPSSKIDSILPASPPALDLSEGAILKPTLDLPQDRKHNKKVSAHQILYQMMERAENAIKEHDKDKLEAVKSKIDTISKEQHQLDVTLKDTSEKAIAWERRKNVAQNFLHIAGAIVGGSAMIFGSPLTGAALLAGGLGGLTSSVLNHYEVNPKITGALSLASGVVSTLGGLGAALNPVSEGLFNTIAALIQTSTGILTGSMSAYQNHLQSKSAEYQSKSTMLETQHKLLFEKTQGALTGFKGVVDSSTKTMKALAKAGKRYSRVVAKMIS